MVYAFAKTSPPYDWYLQIDKRRIVSIKKNYQNFGKKLVCVNLSFILLLAMASSATSLDYQKHMFSNEC